MLLKYKYFIKEKISYNKELCQDIWSGDIIRERIRNKLIKIAKDFFEDIELDTDMVDIQFIGSLANFNYNKKSDVDVHIVIDFSDVNEDVNLVKKAVNGEKFQWNTRHNITIKGHDVELYIQDITDKKPHAAIYSLLNNNWIQKPTYDPPKLTDEDLMPKYNSYVYDITELEKLLNNVTDIEELEKYYKRAKEIKKKLSEARSIGVKEKGEFSIENLVFKKLRNEGFVGKLIDVKNGLYDKMFVQ